MRIHGEIKIQRRNDVEVKSDYHDYETILSEDFGHICGYCGKNELVTTKGFETDHFVPDNIDPTRKTDYNNLVNCCFTCNRKKLGKWPTKDKALHHNGAQGFVDPATDEYDLHLKRDISGKIVYITDVGKYMCETAFKFNQRPTQEIWKYMQIQSKLKLLRDKFTAYKSKISNEDFSVYIELDSAVNELHSYLFKKKE